MESTLTTALVMASDCKQRVYMSAVGWKMLLDNSLLFRKYDPIMNFIIYFNYYYFY